MWIWSARVVWALLPVSAGGALSDALESWSSTPARVAAVLLWVAWTCGLVALLAPRPWGVTLLRVVAPLALACVLVSITSTSGGGAVLAVASTVVAVVFALSAPVVEAAANALAYGDERRFPLRVPIPLMLGPLPVAVALAGGGIGSGPLLLADGRLVPGALTLVAGLPAAALVARSLHVLSRRWIVLVPAGVVVVDPLTLLDPALVRREDTAALRRVTGADLAADPLDLRLGTLPGSVALVAHEAQSFARRRGRRDADVRRARTVLVAVVRADELLTDASARRIPTV